MKTQESPSGFPSTEKEHISGVLGEHTVVLHQVVLQMQFCHEIQSQITRSYSLESAHLFSPDAAVPVCCHKK